MVNLISAIKNNLRARQFKRDRRQVRLIKIALKSNMKAANLVAERNATQARLEEIRLKALDSSNFSVGRRNLYGILGNLRVMSHDELIQLPLTKLNDTYYKVTFGRDSFDIHIFKKSANEKEFLPLDSLGEYESRVNQLDTLYDRFLSSLSYKVGQPVRIPKCIEPKGFGFTEVRLN